MGSCKTIIKIEPIAFPTPIPPDRPGVEFFNTADLDNIEDGLWISYEDGKKLAKYLIDLESYSDQLNIIIIKYYEPPGN